MSSAEYQHGIQRDAFEDSKREVRCQDCRFCGWDPDGNYCASKEGLELSGGFGKSLHVMRAEDGPCGPSGKLFERK